MGTKLIKKMVQHRARNRILLAIVMIAIALGIAYTEKDFMLSFVKGVPEIKNVKDISQNYVQDSRFVKIHVKYVMDLEYQIETVEKENGVEKSRKITEFFVMAEVESGVVLIKLPIKYLKNLNTDLKDVDIRGKLSYPESYEKQVFSIAETRLKNALDVTSEEIGNYLPEMYIDASKETSQTIVLLSSLALTVIGLILVITSIILFVDYKISALYRSLKNLGDTDTIEAAIDQEYADGAGVLANNHNNYVLPTYILHKKVTLSAAIVWVYPKRVRSRYSTQYFIQLGLTPKGWIGLQVKAKQQEPMIERLAESLDVVVGYDKELEKLYNKDHEAFLRLREEKKMQSQVPDLDI